MRKLFINFVLLAAGLLIGTNAWATDWPVVQSSATPIPEGARGYVYCAAVYNNQPYFTVSQRYYYFYDNLSDIFNFDVSVLIGISIDPYNSGTQYTTNEGKIDGFYLIEDNDDQSEIAIPSTNISVYLQDSKLKTLTIASGTNVRVDKDFTISSSLINDGVINNATSSKVLTLLSGARLINNTDATVKYLNITGQGTITNDGTMTNIPYVDVPSWTNNSTLKINSSIPSGKIFTLPTGTGSIAITATGMFNTDPSAYISDPYYAVQNGSNWEVKKRNYVAQVGDTKYEDFMLAYNAVSDGGTMTLLKSITLSSNLEWNKNVTIAGDYTITVAEGDTLTIPSGKTFTFIGTTKGCVTVNGSLIVRGTIDRTIAASNTTSSNYGSVITMNNANATLDIDGGTVKGIFYYYGAPIIISKAKNVNITNSATITNTKANETCTGTNNYGVYIKGAIAESLSIKGARISSYSHGLYNNTSKPIIVEDCEITVTSGNGVHSSLSQCTLINNEITASNFAVVGDPVIVYSGTYTSTGSSAVNGLDESKLYGGKFIAQSSAAVLMGSSLIASVGTQFNKQVASSFYVNGNSCVQKSADLWEIVVGANFLKVNNSAEYNTFDAMAAALKDNDVIDVIGDGIMTGAVTIDKQNVTFNLNGHKLSSETYINRSNVAMLNITGSMIVNGTTANSMMSVPGGMFYVAEGAELTINGGEYETTLIPTPCRLVNNFGKLTINNATMNAGSGCIENSGVANIDGGTYTSLSTSKAPAGHPEWQSAYTLYYCYGIINNAAMNISNATIKGVQGALACQKEGARLTVRNCDVSAAHSQGYTENDSHAALYVCTYAIADVYNSSFKSERKDYSVYVGNNDMTTKWGVVNLYAGTKLAHKAYVQTAKTANATFNPIVPKNSTWYTNWQEGSNIAPLPDGYTYAEYNQDGYAWIVNGPADKQEESVVADAETIPWSQTSTWSEGAVPTEATIATIPDKKVVEIGQNEEAKAYQVFIGGNDAKLTVKEDAFLTVGDGGMNIAEGGQMVIEPGAVVKVGAAGVINSSDDAILIKAEEGKAGAFLIGPAVNEATHPYATVEMYTRAREISNVEHRWQHFAIPTNGKPAVTPLPHDHGEDANLIYIYDWNYTSKEWETLGSWDKLCEPFKGYDLTNNLPADTYASEGGVTYVFHGNIIGNGNGDLKFLSKGYNFFGNSYTAPIDIATMFESLDANIEKTIAIYDVEKNQYVYSNKAMIELGFETTDQIYPLQGFFLNLRDKSSLNDQINYKDAVYDNPRLEAGHGGLSAPARRAQNISANTVAIHVEANGNADCITLVEMSDLSNDFENGFDATKLMNESNLNLFANTMAGQLGVVATNNLIGTAINFQSNDSKQYTMTFSNVNGQVYELLDVMTGVRTRMEEGAIYTFNADANKTVVNRFQVCAASDVITSNETVEGDAAAYGIFTMLGQPMGNDWNALPSGVYVINGVRVIK